jgi:hypothetical protein
MGFKETLAKKAAEAKQRLSQHTDAAKNKARVASLSLASKLETKDSVANTSMILTPEETEEITSLISGSLQELSEETRSARLEKVTEAGDKPCPCCTRSLRSIEAYNKSGGMLGLKNKKHLAIEFLFPADEELCIDCAINKQIEIPCKISGNMFVPEKVKKAELYGHTIISPEFTGALVTREQVLQENRTLRTATQEELDAEVSISNVKKMFSEDKIKAKPRLYFDITCNPVCLLGHYAKLKAETAGIDTFSAGLDDGGALYVQIDHEFFTMSEKNGAIEIRMCVDPSNFELEKASMLAGAFKGGVVGATGTYAGAEVVRSITRSNRGSSGKAAAAGAAAGIAIGMMKANKEKKAVQAAERENIREYIEQVVFGGLAAIIKSGLLEQEPPILSTASLAPTRHTFSEWPEGAEIGRAASV